MTRLNPVYFAVHMGNCSRPLWAKPVVRPHIPAPEETNTITVTKVGASE
jgi:hypothetical protein